MTATSLIKDSEIASMILQLLPLRLSADISLMVPALSQHPALGGTFHDLSRVFLSREMNADLAHEVAEARAFRYDGSSLPQAETIEREPRSCTARWSQKQNMDHVSNHPPDITTPTCCRYFNDVDTPLRDAYLDYLREETIARGDHTTPLFAPFTRSFFDE